MANVLKLGSTKRFGARYGRRVREKLAEIEKDQKKKQKCPYCNQLKVKRIAVGIWHCNKCKTKFAGRAYSLKERVIKEEGVKNG
jgi:large subunit ribosomal protein L37Ae|tara:strand:+ start:229 stop:480 length:252 start_codon:yes stop_codon:yes gene_type:complete